MHDNGLKYQNQALDKNNTALGSKLSIEMQKKEQKQKGRHDADKQRLTKSERH